MQKIDLVQSHDVIGMYEKLDFNQERRKYTDPGTVYAFDVLDGKITTGYLIKLAAFRHLRDLQRQGQADFPYTYDIHESEKLLKFASICPNVDTGEPTKLMDWQKFIFQCFLVGGIGKEARDLRERSFLLLVDKEKRI